MAITEEVVQLVRAAQARAVEVTDEQVLALVTAWVNAWDELQPEFSAAVEVLLANADELEFIPAGTVARNQRVTQALQQAQQRLDELTQTTNATITSSLSSVLLDAAETRYQTLLAQLPGGAEHVLLNRLNSTVLDAIVARTTQQIHAATIPLTDDAVTAMRAELVRGITVGANPNETARKLVRRTEDQFNGGLVRATRIARTETLDAMRTADLAAAQANRNVVQHRVWLATLDARTCSSCLAQHGTQWPVDQFGPEDHHQGRCVFIEQTKSWAELGFTGIEEPTLDLTAQRDAWWDNLSEDTKQQILGPSKYKLWQDGNIDWQDLSKRVSNEDWRSYLVEKPLGELIP